MLIIIAVNPSRRSISNTNLSSPPSNIAPVEQASTNIGDNCINFGCQVQVLPHLHCLLLSRTKIKRESKHRNCPERPSDSGQLYYSTRNFINQNLGI